MVVKLLEVYLGKKLDKKRIISYIDRLETKKAFKNDDKKEIKVSCVQRSIKLVKSVEEYIDIINSFVMKAAEEKSKLVVFPEYNFFDLLGLIPGFVKINEFLNKRSSSEEQESDGNSRLIYSVFFAISRPTQSAIETIMCSLAKKYGIYIYTGSYLIREGEKLYNGGALISREGEIIGYQKKIHLTDFEKALGIKRSCSLEVFSTDIGRIAFPVCMDATYFETFNIARRLGCDILIIPIANNEEYSIYRALRGIWARVQESHVYGLKSSLNGWLFGMHFTGKAGIFAPISLTEKKNGIIAISRNSEGNSLITGVINLNKLYKEREEAEYYGDINREFERDYYERTYTRGMENEK